MARRVFIFFLLILALGGGMVGRAGDPVDLLPALQAAQQGGLGKLFALRAMLWTEPVALITPPSPSLEERTWLNKAVSLAQTALSGPESLPAAVLLGHLTRALGRSEEAEDYYRRALAGSPDYTPALLGLVDLYLDRREVDRAMTYLAAVKSREGEVLQAVEFRRGILALWRGEGASALNLWKAWSEPQGEEAWAYLFCLAKAYLQIGDLTAAQQIMARKAPAWAEGLWAGIRALLAQALGDGQETASELARAAALRPGEILWDWERMAVGLMGDGPFPSPPPGETLGSRGPIPPGGFFLSGLLKEGKGDYPGAVKDYSTWFEMRPYWGLACYHLGRVFFSAGRYEEALRYLGRGMLISPDLPALYLQRAEIYERLKMSKQAAQDRAKAASLDPPSAVAGWSLGVRLMDGIALFGLSGGEGPPPAGVFYSRDGRNWLWRPWRQTMLPFPGVKPGEKIYVLPDIDHPVLLAAVVPAPFSPP